MSKLTYIINIVKRHTAMCMSILLFILYLLPFFILRQQAHYAINDNLDWITGWTLLAQSGQTFSLTGTIEQVMNGVPRSCLPSGLNVITWLYIVCTPFRAYFINDMIVHIMAFIGMYLLLKKYIIPDQTSSWITWSVALCFGIIPFYGVYGLSIAGQPLLAYAFYNAYYNKKTALNYLIIALFALYSSLPLSGIFIGAILFVILLVDRMRQGKVNRNLLYCWLFLIGCYFITEFWLIYNYFFSQGFVSTRGEIDRIALGQNKDFTGVLELIGTNFINGQYHAVSLHKIIVCVALPLALVTGYLKKINMTKIFILVGTALLFSVIYGLRYWTEFMLAIDGIGFLKSFQIQRFHWIHPLLWYVLFAMALQIISKIKHLGRYIAIFLVTTQIFYLYGNNIEYSLKLKEKLGIEVMENAWLYEDITYAEFFADNLFQEIADYIGRPKNEYKVVNIGIYPAITQYHGFYTLDGRMNIYPLEYKHKFRRVIAKELEKNEYWRKYFDDWGITCYILPAELEYLEVRKSYDLKINNLELDTDALRDLGGNYIFSAAEITNYQQNHLEYMGSFYRSWYPWEIYLYKIPESL